MGFGLDIRAFMHGKKILRKGSETGSEFGIIYCLRLCIVDPAAPLGCLRFAESLRMTAPFY